MEIVQPVRFAAFNLLTLLYDSVLVRGTNNGRIEWMDVDAMGIGGKCCLCTHRQKTCLALCEWRAEMCIAFEIRVFFFYS